MSMATEDGTQTITSCRLLTINMQGQ